MEYHFSLLPQPIQATIFAIGRRIRETAIAADKQASDKRELAMLAATSLSARQRMVMEKRAEVLASITGYEIANSMTRASAIRDFVSAQVTHLQRETVRAKQDEGFALTTADLKLVSRPDPLLQGFGLTAEALAIANNRPTGNGKVSRSTIYEWYKISDNQGVHALAPALTKETKDVPPGFAEFLSYYAKPSKPAMTEALEDYNNDNPDHPLTIDQVRYTLRIKLNDIERNVGREGLLTLRSRMAYVSRSTENLFPTTIYSADGKTFDAEVAHPVHGRAFKPEITTIIDIATRKAVGMAISLKENVISVTEALRNSCCDHGIPAIFYVDRGPGYKNKTFDGDFSGLMGRLSITKMHALPYNSQAKGVIERLNKTVWNKLARKYPTYLGEEMDKEAANAAHKQTRRDIAEFGTSSLLPSWEKFRADCEAAIAAYNAHPHDHLPKIIDPVSGKKRHMSPDEFWESHVRNGFEAVPVEEDIKDDLFRPYEIRTVRRAIVEWNTNEYFHRRLEAYHGEKVMVGYDFADASKVWVREIDFDLGQPGALICVAEFAGNKVDYVPRSYQQKAEETRMKGRLSRIERKRREIELEASPTRFIEAPNVVPMEIIPPAAAAKTPAAQENSTVLIGASESVTETPRRRVFVSDEELAEWALENPESLSVNQVRVLRNCLQKQSAIELFRLSGIDVDQLRNIIRAVA